MLKSLAKNLSTKRWVNLAKFLEANLSLDTGVSVWSGGGMAYVAISHNYVHG